MHFRKASEFKPNTFDETSNTVEVIWATEFAYERHDANGVYDEVLSLDPAHVDLSRLNGASVLNNHRQTGLADVVGVVESVRLENGLGIARIKLSSRPDVQPFVDDIKTGILRHVSVGYVVSKNSVVKPASGKRVKKAIDWQPFEISFVTVPADPHTTVRSQNMSKPKTKTPVEIEEVADENPNTRAEIRTLVRAAKLKSEFADDLIDSEASIDEAREAITQAVAKRSRIAALTLHSTAPSNDDPAIVLQRRTDALASRVMGTAPKDETREYAHDSLANHARSILSMRGETTRGMNDEAVLTRAAQHSLSDFPNLLTGTGQRILMAGYDAAPSALKKVARKGIRTDFRTGSTLRLGEMGLLEKITESGEVKSGTMSESKESYALETFAKSFALSRKAIINDDLGAFRDWGNAMGRAAAETEANLLLGHLTQSSGAGPLMSDAKRLFHVDHGNLAAAGTALDVTSLSTARLAMRLQKGVDGKTPINATPKFLLIGANLETTAEQVLAEIVAAQVSDVNPFSGSLTLLVDSRIFGNQWFVFADPASLPVLEYSYLSGAEGPQLASRDGWDVLGQEFRVILDFGCGALDWRGAYRNAGTP